jgi:hypothetical protein
MLSIETALGKNRPSADLAKSKAKEASLPKRGCGVGVSRGGEGQGQNSFFSVSKEREERANELAAQLNIPRPAIAENKIFKRSAFHVAIAYHIYLNKLREKGPIGSEIDPTYFARRLKEGMQRH